MLDHNMLSLSQAQGLVEEILRAFDGFESDELVILENATIEKSHLCVFFYNSRRYLETGETSYALAGNAPYIVNRLTGEVVQTGTARPIEYYVSQYEAARSKAAV